MATKSKLKVLEAQSIDSIADIMMSARAPHPEKMALASEKQQRTVLEHEIKNNVHRFESSIKHGMELLENRIQKYHPSLRSEVTVLNTTDLAAFVQSEDVTLKIKDGLAFYQIVGVSQEFLDAMHQEAIKLYSEHDLEDARDAFACLITFNHWDQRYWIGYGLCEQFCHKKNIHEAMDAYFMAIGLDETNPYPYIYYAECLAELKDTKVAIEYLDIALKHARHEDQYANVVPQIEQIKARIHMK